MYNLSFLKNLNKSFTIFSSKFFSKFLLLRNIFFKLLKDPFILVIHNNIINYKLFFIYLYIIINLMFQIFFSKIKIQRLPIIYFIYFINIYIFFNYSFKNLIFFRKKQKELKILEEVKPLNNIKKNTYNSFIIIQNKN